MIIYKTNEWSGFFDQEYYWNEYHQEGNRVVKYKCHSQKIFDGKENYESEDRHEEESWDIDDPYMPDWLRAYIF